MNKNKFQYYRLITIIINGCLNDFFVQDDMFKTPPELFLVLFIYCIEQIMSHCEKESGVFSVSLYISKSLKTTN
jgi:hypothetical protein